MTDFWWAGFRFLRKQHLFLAFEEKIDRGVYWDMEGFYDGSRPASALIGNEFLSQVKENEPIIRIEVN